MLHQNKRRCIKRNPTSHYSADDIESNEKLSVIFVRQRLLPSEFWECLNCVEFTKLYGTTRTKERFHETIFKHYNKKQSYVLSRGIIKF